MDGIKQVGFALSIEPGYPIKSRRKFACHALMIFKSLQFEGIQE
jgi:hypothetical protein